MTKAVKKYNAKVSAVWRFVRVVIPQLPAYCTIFAEKAKLVDAPDWVVPTLVFVGAVATALDKYLRDLKK